MSEFYGLTDQPDGRDQCQAEQMRDRERLQQDIQEAWDKLMVDRRYAYCLCANSTSDSDIKLLKWALGVK